MTTPYNTQNSMNTGADSTILPSLTGEENELGLDDAGFFPGGKKDKASKETASLQKTTAEQASKMVAPGAQVLPQGHNKLFEAAEVLTFGTTAASAIYPHFAPVSVKQGEKILYSQLGQDLTPAGKSVFEHHLESRLNQSAPEKLLNLSSSTVDKYAHVGNNYSKEVFNAVEKATKGSAKSVPLENIEAAFKEKTGGLLDASLYEKEIQKLTGGKIKDGVLTQGANSFSQNISRRGQQNIFRKSVDSRRFVPAVKKSTSTIAEKGIVNKTKNLIAKPVSKIAQHLPEKMLVKSYEHRALRQAQKEVVEKVSKDMYKKWMSRHLTQEFFSKGAGKIAKEQVAKTLTKNLAKAAIRGPIAYLNPIGLALSLAFWLGDPEWRGIVKGMGEFFIGRTTPRITDPPGMNYMILPTTVKESAPWSLDLPDQKHREQTIAYWDHMIFSGLPLTEDAVAGGVGLGANQIVNERGAGLAPLLGCPNISASKINGTWDLNNENPMSRQLITQSGNNTNVITPLHTEVTSLVEKLNREWSRFKQQNTMNKSMNRFIKQMNTVDTFFESTIRGTSNVADLTVALTNTYASMVGQFSKINYTARKAITNSNQGFFPWVGIGSGADEVTHSYNELKNLNNQLREVLQNVANNNFIDTLPTSTVKDTEPIKENNLPDIGQTLPPAQSFTPTPSSPITSAPKTPKGSSVDDLIKRLGEAEDKNTTAPTLPSTPRVNTPQKPKQTSPLTPGMFPGGQQGMRTPLFGSRAPQSPFPPMSKTPKPAKTDKKDIKDLIKELNKDKKTKDTPKGKDSAKKPKQRKPFTPKPAKPVAAKPSTQKPLRVPEEQKPKTMHTAAPSTAETAKPQKYVTIDGKKFEMPTTNHATAIKNYIAHPDGDPKNLLIEQGANQQSPPHSLGAAKPGDIVTMGGKKGYYMGNGAALIDGKITPITNRASFMTMTPAVPDSTGGKINVAPPTGSSPVESAFSSSPDTTVAPSAKPATTNFSPNGYKGGLFGNINK